MKFKLNKYKCVVAMTIQVAGLAVTCTAIFLTGCASAPGWLPTSGPSKTAVAQAGVDGNANGIKIIDVNSDVAYNIQKSYRQKLFSQTLISARPSVLVGTGDVVEVSIWEAPPAMLFGAGATEVGSGNHQTLLPEQMVSSTGLVSVPFVGKVLAAGRTTAQIEANIAEKLVGKANQPQVLVRVVKNNTSNVTVVGEVGNSIRMPLTAKGERILDALAAAGGVKQPVNKITIQVTRGDAVQSLPLDTLIKDPRQNVFLQAGDVVTSLYQSSSFSVLGATGKNEEISFEAGGISLAQALARAGGVQDARADARGVFIFRFEDPSAVDLTTGVAGTNYSSYTADGKVPVVYRIDLKNPATFFWAQNFPMQNKDVMYVSNAPAAELSKFLNILTSSIYTINGVRASFP